MEKELNEMTNKELLKYYDEFRFHNKQLKELYEKGKLTTYQDWSSVLRKKESWYQEIRNEVLTRMERETKNGKEKKN